MDIENVIAQLSDNAETIRALVQGYTIEQARRKPDGDAWSVLEVVNHLADEETEDFRARVDYVLHRRGDAWARIEPLGWVVERRYNERKLGPSLERFIVARGESITWLHALGDVDWAVTYEAPFGRMRAGDFLAAWAAHDVLHMRQLVELKWGSLVRTSEPYTLRYAGDW